MLEIQFHGRVPLAVAQSGLSVLVPIFSVLDLPEDNSLRKYYYHRGGLLDIPGKVSIAYKAQQGGRGNVC